MSERIKYLTDIEFGFDVQFVGLPRHRLSAMKDELTCLRKLLREAVQLCDEHRDESYMTDLVGRIRKELGDE